MSQFEYVAIPVSLILTFGLARLLNAFPHVLVAPRTYWVHALWCSTALLNLLFFWWSFWSAHDAGAWTLGSYLLALVYPGLCYVGATILVPADPSAQADWHAYFFRIRKPLFTVAALATALNHMIVAARQSLPYMNLGGLLSAGFVALYMLGFFAAGERVQKTVVLANAGLVVAAYAPLIYRPLGS